MNKNDLIRDIANNAGITIKDATVAFEAVLTSITDSLKRGEKVQISGFGTFDVKVKTTHEGINPKTQEKITVSASKLPSFKFGKAYKDAINS